MSDWFRSWHGAPMDPKWVWIARRAGCAPAIAAAIGWALFDHASQADPRGSVEGFDHEVYACWAGVEEDAVVKAISAMGERGMIAGGRLTNWKKRQPDREDGAAQRAKDWRDGKGKSDPRTHANATERARTQPNAPEEKIDTDTDSPPSSREPERKDRPPQLVGSPIEVLPPEPSRHGGLEQRCRALMGSLPVAVAVDFEPIRRLLDEGITEADVIAGLTDAAADPGFRPWAWGKTVGWVRRAAKNRIAAALGPPLSPPPMGFAARASPGLPAKAQDFRMMALRKLYAEEKARQGAA